MHFFIKLNVAFILKVVFMPQPYPAIQRMMERADNATSVRPSPSASGISNLRLSFSGGGIRAQISSSQCMIIRLTFDPQF